MTQELWMRVVKIIIDNGTYKAEFESSMLEIHFTVPFSDEPRPSECTVDIFNLSNDSRSKIKMGSKVTIFAGYRGDTGIISEGTITRIPPINNSGVDTQTSFTFLEGKDYANKKDVNITFAKGTASSTIITRLAKEAGIPISLMKLKVNKLYGSGYTADGDAMSLIEEVVKGCESSIYFRRGKLVIRNIKEGDDERFNLNSSTGLISAPSYIEEDNAKGWSVQSLLQHRIATASIINLQSKYVKGTFRVKNGTHSFDGSSLTTSCEVY